MNYSPKSQTKRSDRVGEPFAGAEVLNAVQSGRADLSDWVELMDVIEALCPVWPVVVKPHTEGGHRL